MREDRVGITGIPGTEDKSSVHSATGVPSLPGLCCAPGFCVWVRWLAPVLGGLNFRGETGRSALGKRKDGQEHVQVVAPAGTGRWQRP